MKHLLKAIVASGLAASILVGCGTSEPLAVAERAEAKSLIDQAEAAGAAEFAPDALSDARDNLQAAELSVRDEEQAAAQQSAEKAVVDARLALIKTEQAKARKAADELRRSTEALRRESQRPTYQESSPVDDPRPEDKP